MDDFQDRLNKIIQSASWLTVQQTAGEHIPYAEAARETLDQLIILASSENQSKRDLSQGEMLFRTMAENSPDIAWISTNSGNALFFNKRWQEYTGRDNQASLNWEWLSSIEAKDRERILAFWPTQIAQGAPFELEMRIMDGADNKYKWHLVRISPHKDKNGMILNWIANATNIHEMKRFKEELARRVRELQRLNADSEKTRAKLIESETLFRTMCETSPQLIWTCDENGLADFFNAPWSLYTGLSLKDSCGDQWLYTIFSEDVEKYLTVWSRRMKDGQEFEAEIRLRRYDGKYRWHLVRGLPIRHDSGKIVKWCCTCTDIEGHRRLVEELTQARDQAQAASRLKSEFVANMSHEIRTPMNGILGMVEMLLRDQLSPQSREYALMLKDAGKSLLSILNDILDFSKIEAGHLEVSSCEFDLVALIEGVGEIMTSQADAKNLLLTTYIDPRIPETITSDPLRLRQVLLNLTGNALKFTTVGSVTIRVDLIEHIESQAQVLIKFSVIDTGIGISQEQQSKLFDPFVQADGSISRRYGGTGLGLSISKRLVELLGGNIVLESQVDRGSTFSFSIPVMAGREATSALWVRPSESNNRAVVLVVDQEPELSNAICSYASFLGYDTMQAHDFESSMQIINDLRAQKAYLNVVVDGFRNRDLLLEIYEHAFFGQTSDREHLVLLSPQMLKNEIEKLVPGVKPAVVSRPVKKAALKYYLGSESHKSGFFQVGERSQSISGGQSLVSNPVRALVADDNKLNQKVARLLLSGLGLDVTVVENGMEAVAAFDTGEFDLVFLDCQMPELDGYAAARIIKRLQGQKHLQTPVIAMTANAFEGVREDCLAAGMDDYIAKPIEPMELEKIVNHWLQKSIKQQEVTQDIPISTPSGSHILTSEAAESQIDYDLLLSRFNSANSRELLKMFADSTPRDIATLEKSAQSVSFKDIKDQAHGLKGACATICAPKMADLCKQLEEAGKATELERCKNLIARLKRACDLAIAEIDQHLKQVK